VSDWPQRSDNLFASGPWASQAQVGNFCGDQLTVYAAGFSRDKRVVLEGL
jgi:hypothetical protein